jgi:hypothetical protein
MTVYTLFHGVPTNDPAYADEALSHSISTIVPISVFATTLTPEAAIRANPGSMAYVKYAAANANDGLWLKATGTSTTGWVQMGTGGLLQNATYIADPTAAPYNADRTALQIFTAQESVVAFAPTATRKIDVRTITSSMAFTIIKTNAAAFGITIDVTTGGNQGWTTSAGLNTDLVLLNSAAAATGSWLVRLDLPNKTVITTPA